MEKKIKTEVYKWGEYLEPEDITKKELTEMEELDPRDLLGFNTRKEDEEKRFFAYSVHIERTAYEGTGIKFCHAISKEDLNL